MKKNVVAIALLVASQQLSACQVMITNTTRDAVVSVFDEDSKETRTANEGQAIRGNSNADSHAHLIITITHDDYPTRIYKFTQFACSKSHEIPVTSSQIIHGLEATKNADDMDIEQLVRVEPVVQK